MKIKLKNLKANDKIIKGDHQKIFGNNNTVNGDFNTIIGNNNNVCGDFNNIVGDNNTSMGDFNKSYGKKNKMIGEKCKKFSKKEYKEKKKEENQKFNFNNANISGSMRFGNGNSIVIDDGKVIKESDQSASLSCKNNKLRIDYQGEIFESDEDGIIKSKNNKTIKNIFLEKREGNNFIYGFNDNTGKIVTKEQGFSIKGGNIDLAHLFDKIEIIDLK